MLTAIARKAGDRPQWHFLEVHPCGQVDAVDGTEARCGNSLRDRLGTMHRCHLRESILMKLSHKKSFFVAAKKRLRVRNVSLARRKSDILGAGLEISRLCNGCGSRLGSPRPGTSCDVGPSGPNSRFRQVLYPFLALELDRKIFFQKRKKVYNAPCGGYLQHVVFPAASALSN